MTRKKLYLIDGNSYCYRAFYAMGDLRTADGRPTGAVFGFINMLNKVRSEEKPDYLGICFDLKGPTLRHEKFEAYKAHRKPMPDDLQPQMQIIKDVVCAYGIAIFQMSGYEADDIIATLTKKFKPEVDVFIASADKDMLQLVDDYVKIYNPQGKITIVDAAGVYQRFEIKPSQITDLLALTGDSADNIPGVPGIGPKTAQELIKEYGDLENILKNTDTIKQNKRRELLREFADQARLSKELATVISDVPLDITLEELKGSGMDLQALKRIFSDLEFRNLYRNIVGLIPAENSGVAVKLVDRIEPLAELAEKLRGAGELSISMHSQPDGEYLEIGRDAENLFRVELNRAIDAGSLKKFLGPLLSDNRILKIGYDLKKNCRELARSGIYLDEPFFDILIAAYLLEPGAESRGIADIAANYIKRNIDVRIIVAEQFAIKLALEEQLKEKQLEDLFIRIEMPLVRVLASMEQSGISVNRKFLETLNVQIEDKLKGLIRDIYSAAGCEFNINSPKQLSEVLFERLKLTVVKKGKNGPSTDVEVLMRLAAEHKLPELILEYRELAKLQSTYVAGMLALIDPRTGRIHTSFNQAVTATGRLSSSAPNLQNIPKRTESGRQIRAAFVSRAGDWTLLCADYSQIELRVLAHLSQDDILIKAFNAGRDVHAFTAALLFDVSPENVGEQMRNQAKRVNFGIIYGMGAHGLARDIGVPYKEAKNFIDEYFKRYPQIKRYLDRQIADARAQGYVTTLLNRRRYIPQINYKDAMQRSFAERTAMNTPIQGTAADLIKIAMIDIYRAFKQAGLKAVMLLQVHDELVFDVPDEEMPAVVEIVKNSMEQVVKLSVPITVDLKSGKNWRDVNPI